jgi:hypothetical protein
MHACESLDAQHCVSQKLEIVEYIIGSYSPSSILWPPAILYGERNQHIPRIMMEEIRLPPYNIDQYLTAIF